MPHFPNEADLIERMWGLICNSMDLKAGSWNDSADSIQWREVMAEVRDEYHNWLEWYLATHRAEPLDPETVTTYDLIQSLKMFCPCGEDDGAWLSRAEANLIIAKLSETMKP